MTTDPVTTDPTPIPTLREMIAYGAEGLTDAEIDLAAAGVRAAALRDAGVDDDTLRLAAIGRSVIEHLMPDNPAALRQATAERVVDRLRRDRDELRSFETCEALRVGRHVLALRDALGLRPRSEP